MVSADQQRGQICLVKMHHSTALQEDEYYVVISVYGCVGGLRFDCNELKFKDHPTVGHWFEAAKYKVLQLKDGSV